MDKRICYVQIQTQDGGKQIENIALKGRIERKASVNGSTAKISIANLSKPDVEYLSTYTSRFVDPAKQKKINIIAGYESTGAGMIFSGDIVSAMPEGLPDTWLNIEAKSNYHNQTNIINYSINNAKTQDIAQNIATQYGLALDWRSKSQKLIDCLNISGAKSRLLNELNKLDNFRAYIDNGVLRVVDKDEEPPKESQTPKTFNSNISDNKKTGYVKLINADSGLIGIPKIDEYGVVVKILIDPSINLGDWFKLESRLYPAINGFYQIYEMVYDFASREPQFYIELKGKNKRV
jgi:hypothetical protein